MNLLTISLIAVALAMDAFAISIASGAATKESKLNSAFKIALFFGAFQAIMPVIGWLIGHGLRDFISGVDHWIAFGLLTIIGIRMIYESFEIEPSKKTKLNLNILLMLSIATSIDALAVGISFAFLKIFIMTPVIIIGLITFILSFAGFFIGDKIGHIFENYVEIAGGLILVGIGIKILVEHLVI